jgi:roadblock/LC7 domain-containing protein
LTELFYRFEKLLPINGQITRYTFDNYILRYTGEMEKAEAEAITAAAARTRSIVAEMCGGMDL